MLNKNIIGRRTGYLELFRVFGTSLKAVRIYNRKNTKSYRPDAFSLVKEIIVCKNCGYNRRPLTKLEDGTYQCFKGCER